jgi:thioredoxin-like negative regulator of GroEL
MEQTDTKGIHDAIADHATPLVVDLHAPWCKFCKLTQPHIERLAVERAGSIRFVGSDVDDNIELYKDLKVGTIPAIILFKDGVEVARRGSGDLAQLEAWLAENGL